MIPMDLHIHSTFSDGHNAPEEIVQAAIDKGLLAIMIVDHVRRSSEWVPEFAQEIRRLRAKYGHQIVLFCGLEAKFLSTDGELDITEEQRSCVDFVLAAFHRTPHVHHGGAFDLCAWVKAIQAGCHNRTFDILAHPTSILDRLRIPIDKSAVIDVCHALKDTQTYFELNAKYPASKEVATWVLDTDTGISVGSDAHKIADLTRLDNVFLSKKSPNDPLRIWCPIFSIVIPVYNEALYIEKTIQAVIDQTYPADHMEIICIDGGSTDRSRELIANLNHGSPSIQLLDNPEQIAATGMNIGIKHACGDRIIILGAHTLIEPDFLIQNIRTSVISGAECTGGRHENLGKTRIGRVISIAMRSPFGMGGSHYRYSLRASFVDTVAYGAYARHVFEQIGLFDETMVRNQDDEFNYRLLEHGGKIYFDPRIRSKYYVRSSLSKLWRQYFQYGYWKVHVMQKHPRQMRIRHFVPATFVMALVGSALVTIVSPFIWWLTAAIGGSYVIANAVASVWTLRDGSWKYLSSLPITFATLHFSYGLGFSYGLLDFFIRKRS